MTFNDLDLAERLDSAREGTAYFAQKLAEAVGRGDVRSEPARRVDA